MKDWKRKEKLKKNLKERKGKLENREKEKRKKREIKMKVKENLEKNKYDWIWNGRKIKKERKF